jgi:transposase
MSATTSTVEALVYGLREGIEMISEGERMRRLSELSERQLCEVCERLQNFNPDIAPPWTVQQVKSLIGIWRRVHA